MINCFLVGAKSIGAYGGYETFVNKLISYHENEKSIQYHVACKANGIGKMDERLLDGCIVYKENNQFTYKNAICYKFHVPKIGGATAIIYDLIALYNFIKQCKTNNINKPIFYIMACRIGPFMPLIAYWIKKYEGKIYVNPDGHEWMRDKWNFLVKKYWKISERLMMKYCDIAVCDSVNIEKYIKKEYKTYDVRTTYISYGAEIDTDCGQSEVFKIWLEENGIKANEYYVSVGRLVPENNFDVMIREYMKSRTKKNYIIIATKEDKYLNKLENKYHFSKDNRIKFVGPIYDQSLLKEIRKNAYAYFHGHSVGGTNPSLLEALGYTKLNLIYDVGFNREVALDAALYWSLEAGSLSKQIEKVETLSDDVINEYAKKAKKRVFEAYSWRFIAGEYKKLWEQSLKISS